MYPLAILLFGFVSAALAASQPGALFHGYTVIIQTSPQAPAMPGNSTFKSSNFFSYGGNTGYLSFGWNLPAASNTTTSQCKPDNRTFDFYEYGTGDCQLADCRVTAHNFNRTNPGHANSVASYIATTVKVGDVPESNLALSYFDEKNGAYGVGSRDLLSGNNTDAATTKQCQEAFATLQYVKKTYNPPINFELVNPCSS